MQFVHKKVGQPLARPLLIIAAAMIKAQIWNHPGLMVSMVKTEDDW
jgi:hypothetical protein